MKRLLLLIPLVLTLVLSGCSSSLSPSSSSSSSSGASKYPVKNISFVVPAKPGGAWDLTARSMEKVLKDNKLVSQNITIDNKPGGNAEVAWQYLKGQDSYHLAMSSALLITNKLLDASQLTYENFTPIATINTDWETVAVPTDSPYQTAKDLMQKLKENPNSIKIGVFGLGNNAHLAFVKAAKSYGVDTSKLNFLVYGSGAEIVPALLGHHIDAATMYISETADQFKAGKLKLLAIDTEKRLKGLDVPTWKEQGVDLVFPNWRGIIGPANMTKEEVAFWDAQLSKMVQTDEWKKIQEDNQWDAYYLNSADTKKLFEEQTKIYAELIKDAGLDKKK